MEQVGGQHGCKPAVGVMTATDENINLATADPAVSGQLAALAKERVTAIGFPMGADPNRHEETIESFENACTVKRDEWPRTLTQAHNTLTNWKGTVSKPQPGTDGVSFLADGDTEERPPR